MQLWLSEPSLLSAAGKSIRRRMPVTSNAQNKQTLSQKTAAATHSTESRRCARCKPASCVRTCQNILPCELVWTGAEDVGNDACTRTQGHSCCCCALRQRVPVQQVPVDMEAVNQAGYRCLNLELAERVLSRLCPSACSSPTGMPVLLICCSQSLICIWWRASSGLSVAALSLRSLTYAVHKHCAAAVFGRSSCWAVVCRGRQWQTFDCIACLH